MWRKLSAAVAALALTGTLAVGSAGDATAHDYYRHHHRHNNGAFVGGLIVGGLALGALGADAYYHDYDYDGGRCYRGRPRCHWVREECGRDRWGDYHCDGGYRRCYRPLICD